MEYHANRKLFQLQEVNKAGMLGMPAHAPIQLNGASRTRLQVKLKDLSYDILAGPQAWGGYREVGD